MGNWSELQFDLLDLIAGRLMVVSDRARFSGVCRNWLSVAKSKTNYLPSCNPPWLMLVEKPDDSDNRGFVGLTKGEEIFDIYLPEAKGTRCVSCNGSWLVMVDANCDMFILNPFSRVKLELPPLSALKEDYMAWAGLPGVTNLDLRNHNALMGKVLLSFPITKSPVEAFLVVAIVGEYGRLAYSRKGDKLWTNINPQIKKAGYRDIAFYQGKYYAVNSLGTVYEFNMSFRHHGKPNLKEISDNIMTMYNGQKDRYLVEFEGVLLQVVRHVTCFGEPHSKTYTFGGQLHHLRYRDYKTTSVNVFELDFQTGGWVEVNDLGQRSIFAGFNTCVSLLANSSSSFKPNCIYFTDTFSLGYHGDSPFQGGRDMIVFDMVDRTIERHYTGRHSLSSFSPPIWVIPTSMYSKVENATFIPG